MKDKTVIAPMLLTARNVSRLTCVAAVAVNAAPAAAGAGETSGAYFERVAQVRVPGPGVDIVVSPETPLYASVRTISVWCQFPLASGSNPTGALVQVMTRSAAEGSARVTVPLSLQLADDHGASPSRYFAGTTGTFLEVAPATASHISVLSDASSVGERGVCYISFFGVLLTKTTHP